MIQLSKIMIDGIFARAKEQADYFLALYKIAFPNWDEIKAISGHPKVSAETNRYIFDLAIAFDKEKHPDVVNGGLWMNKGFGTDEGVKDWVVDLSICQVEYENSPVL